MLRNVNDFYGAAVTATDGPIGEVRDLLFDDQSWTVRFLVVESGAWPAQRNVSLSPIAIRNASSAASALSVSVRDAVKASPAYVSVDARPPARSSYVRPLQAPGLLL